MLQTLAKEEARVREEMLGTVPRVRQTSAKRAAFIEELFRRHRSDRDEMLRKKQKDEMASKKCKKCRHSWPSVPEASPKSGRKTCEGQNDQTRD